MSVPQVVIDMNDELEGVEKVWVYVDDKWEIAQWRYLEIDEESPGVLSNETKDLPQ